MNAVAPIAEAHATTLALAVGDIGLRCAAGDQPFGLFGATGSGFVLGKPEPSLAVPTHDGSIVTGIPIGPAVAGPLDATRRMQALLADVLGRLFAGSAQEDTGILLLVPGAAQQRESLAADAWEAVVRGIPGVLPDAPIFIREPAAGVLAELETAARILREGRVARLVFGAVDSLLDMRILAGLGQQRLLYSKTNRDGCTPGEAAVFLTLTLAENAPGNARSRLHAVAVCPEPDEGRAGETVLYGLGRAVEALAGEAGVPVSAIDCLALGLAGRLPRYLEWQQASNRLWPQRLPESQREAMQRGELDAPQPPAEAAREILDVAATLGDTGLAEPLLSTVIGLERLNFEWPPRQHVVVAETGMPGSRAALWIGNESPP